MLIASSSAVILASGAHLSTTELAVVPEFVIASLLVVMPILTMSGFYRQHRHSATMPGLLSLLPGSLFGVGACWFLARGIGWLPELPVTTFPIMLLIMLTLFVGARVTALTREVMRRNRRHAAIASQGEPVVLVGLGATSDLFMRAVHQGLSPYKVVGIIDDSMESTDLLFHSVPILGSIRDPKPIIRKLMTAEELPRCLLLTETVTHFDREGIEMLRNWAEAQGIKVRSLPNLTEEQPTFRMGGNVATIDPEDVLTRPQKRVEMQLLRDTYRGKRVLVTGAGGSIGSELVRQLASLNPAELVLVENSEFNAYQVDRLLGRHFPDVPRALHLCCIRDRVHLQSIFEEHRPDMVFNAAALKHVPLVEANPCEGVLTNVIGTRNVCDAARSVGVKAFVQVSTDKAVNTTNIMGATKRVAEFYCQAQDLITRDLGCDTRFFAVRFGNVLGSSGSLIPLFQEQIARGGPLTVTHPDMERYFMTIREAVELTLVAAAQGLRSGDDNGRIYVLDMGQPVRIVDLAERMIRMAGKEPGKDVKIDFIGIRPGEKLFEELFDRTEVVQPAGFAGVSCAIPNAVPMSRLRAALLKLERSARSGDEQSVRRGLADLVPGFGGALPEAEVRPFPAPKPQPAASRQLSRPPVEAEIERGKAFA
ncbi:polysaccharide biosynthesis protein [Paracoccus sediminicola]|uniref:polysaccharide biosynthesis protein n=1 Tax=Paracoccus sediminicola TaxID=3017783 RepID=UPI0022F0E12F|nr:nucleoside-diphosphate sugar epimerase/dehydratase [Paracoccus sediminicola]WBU56496.1 nucleoside-diphosphate sugar epimerase/dehydratase [Paracoccus sediminicola]